MCGIAGAVGNIDDTVRRAVERMGEAQSHRGPDGAGIWSTAAAGEGAGVVLSHRRLAIIDLTEDGAQPMRDRVRGNVLIFNGEIYNYREIRQDLEAQGAEFESASDTEVLLQAYGAWGAACVDRLRGMFAFAVWDAAQRRLLLVRDRVGVKPLYMAPVERRGDSGVLLFASELRALLASGLVERRLSPVGVASYLWNGFVPGPGTIARDVELLEPGTLRSFDETGKPLESRRYWSLPRAGNSTDTEPLRAELARAVELRLVSDVPLGIFLSGGVDSSVLTNLAARAGDGRIRTFNVGFEEAGYDESAHARAVAAAVGAEHQEIRLTQRRFRAQMGDALACLDQPSFDAINTYFVSRAVREAGITVALAGTGGDEVFGGYRSFADLPRAVRWGRRLRVAPEPLLRAVGGGLGRWFLGGNGDVPPQTRWAKIGDALAARGRLVELYQLAYSLFSRDFLAELLVPGSASGTAHGLRPARAAALHTLVEGEPLLHGICLLELSCFVGDRLLRDTDAASMAVSLEARVPLLDHRVIETAAEIAPERRFQPVGRKRLLRELGLEGLDASLFERSKSGFVLPIERWCRDQLRGELDTVLGDGEACESVGLNVGAVMRVWRAFQGQEPGIYWTRIWALFVLLIWCRTHRMHL
jgi:asparagine synthase (glutamine-hydrolysing)